MATPGPSILVAMRVIDELYKFSEEVYDSLMYLRDDKRAKNDKFMLLNEVIVAAEEDITRKEAHVDIMKVAISSG
nr:hypothetical protein [Tanacetum cinerariifolium]